jgi:hypothetical protein
MKRIIFIVKRIDLMLCGKLSERFMVREFFSRRPGRVFNRHSFNPTNQTI